MWMQQSEWEEMAPAVLGIENIFQGERLPVYTNSSLGCVYMKDAVIIQSKRMSVCVTNL